MKGPELDHKCKWILYIYFLCFCGQVPYFNPKGEIILRQKIQLYQKKKRSKVLTPGEYSKKTPKIIVMINSTR